jgi:flagellar hook-length control protein FliK
MTIGATGPFPAGFAASPALPPTPAAAVATDGGFGEAVNAALGSGTTAAAPLQAAIAATAPTGRLPGPLGLLDQPSSTQRLAPLPSSPPAAAIEATATPSGSSGPGNVGVSVALRQLPQGEGTAPPAAIPLTIPSMPPPMVPEGSPPVPLPPSTPVQVASTPLPPPSAGEGGTGEQASADGPIENAADPVPTAPAEPLPPGSAKPAATALIGISAPPPAVPAALADVVANAAVPDAAVPGPTVPSVGQADVVGPKPVVPHAIAPDAAVPALPEASVSHTSPAVPHPALPEADGPAQITAQPRSGKANPRLEDAPAPDDEPGALAAAVQPTATALPTTMLATTPLPRPAVDADAGAAAASPQNAPSFRSAQGTAPPSQAEHVAAAGAPTERPANDGSPAAADPRRDPATAANSVFALPPDRADAPATAVPIPAGASPAAAATAAPSPASPASLASVTARLPTPPAHATVSAHAGQIGREMGVAIAHRLRDGGDELTVRLNPAEMGRVEVTMSFDERGTLRATVAAERAAALDLLRGDRAELGRALTEAGVRTDAGSFRFDSRPGGGSFGSGLGGNAGNGQPWQRSAGQEGTLARRYVGDAAVSTQSVLRTLRTAGRVDLMA